MDKVLKNEFNKLGSQLQTTVAEALKDEFKKIHNNLAERDLEIKDEFKRIHNNLAERGIEIKDEFKKMNKRFDLVDKRFEGMDQQFENINQRFEGIDRQFESIDQRFEGMDQQFEGMDRRFIDMNDKFDFLLYTTKTEFDRLDSKIDITNERVTGIHNHIDGFLTLHQRIDHEVVAVYGRQDRLEARIEKLEN